MPKPRNRSLTIIRTWSETSSAFYCCLACLARTNPTPGYEMPLRDARKLKRRRRLTDRAQIGIQNHKKARTSDSHSGRSTPGLVHRNFLDCKAGRPGPPAQVSHVLTDRIHAQWLCVHKHNGSLISKAGASANAKRLDRAVRKSATLAMVRSPLALSPTCSQSSQPNPCFLCSGTALSIGFKLSLACGLVA